MISKDYKVHRKTPSPCVIHKNTNWEDFLYLSSIICLSSHLPDFVLGVARPALYHLACNRVSGGRPPPQQHLDLNH